MAASHFPSNFHSAFAAGPDAENVVRSCLQQLDGLVRPHGLGIAYWARPLESQADEIITRLRSNTGIHHWVGASADRVIGGGRVLNDGGLSVLTMPLPDNQFALFDGLADDRAQMSQGLVHATIEQDMLSGLERSLRGSHAQFCGAQIQDGQHLAQSLCAGGLSGVLFHDRLPIETMISRALAPAGPVHELTSLYSDIVAGIDGRDPVDVLRNDVGELLMRDQAKLRAHILLELCDDEAPEQRAEVAAIEEIDIYARRLRLDRPLRATQVQVMRRDPDRGLTDLAEQVRFAARNMQPLGAVIYIMSSRRGENLFGQGSDELSVVRELVSNTPVIGLVSDREVFQSRDEFCSSVAMLIGQPENHS